MSILDEYRALAGAAHVDISSLRKGHDTPIAYSEYARRRAEIMGLPYPMNAEALARFNEFRSKHGSTLNELLAA